MPLRRTTLRIQPLEDRTVPAIVGPLSLPELKQIAGQSAPRVAPPPMPGISVLPTLVGDAIIGAWKVPVGTSTSEWTFQFASGTGPEVLGSLDVVSAEPQPYWPNSYLIKFETAKDVATFRDSVSTTVAPQFFYPQVARQAAKKFIPNDTLFGSQWHLNNTGQSGGTANNDADLPEAWDLTDNSSNPIRGTGVQIAIVDDGLEHTHLDLAPNYVAADSFDFNDNDPNPTPESAGDGHGTSAAGVAAARGNNNRGVSGSAPNASLTGIRLIAAAVTGAVEAQALSYEIQDNDIYSNSWGPTDNGTYGSIFPETAAAFIANTTSGRGGLGSIYTWAAGNGLASEDNVNLDPYANSRYVIAVGAIDHNGVQSSYSEPGSAMLVTAYSSGGSAGISTVDLSGANGYNSNGSGNFADTDYTDDFGGTSSATPLVSGVVALMLQANPNLTWRDVKAVLVESAKKNDPTDPGWSVNGDGRNINEKYGFGAVDADAAVATAKTWTNLPAETSVTSGTVTVNQLIPDFNSTGVTSTTTIGADISIETVEVRVNVPDHTYIGDLAVTLTSPSGTVSQLAAGSTGDSTDGLVWTYTTNRSWGESSAGLWTLKIADLVDVDEGTWQDWSITIYGTDQVTRPVISNLEPAALSFTEGGADLPVSSTVSITDMNNANLSGATVSITSGYVNGQDSLLFTNQNGISGNFNSTNGTLTLTGTSSLANYATALRSVRYSNASQDPSTTPRTLSFRVTDTSSEQSDVRTRTLNVLAVNDAPTIASIANQNVNEDASETTVPLTGIGTGGETQTLTVTATSSDPSIVPHPTITYTSPAATGSLKFTPAANKSGQVTITVTVQDSGNTANGGVNTITRTFTIDVASVNDAPSFTKGQDQLINLNSPPQTVTGWATAISPGPSDESGQTVSFTLTNDNNAMFDVQPAIDASGNLTYTPANGASGTAIVTVNAIDTGGIANGGVDTTTKTFTIYIDQGINDAPILDNSGSPTMIGIPQNITSHQGDLIADIIGDSITDLDFGTNLEGVAVVGSGGIAGTWQYSIDAGTTWINIGTASESAARLLRPEDRIRLLPTPGAIGFGQITYRAWDQTSGNAGDSVDLTVGTGGTTAFSVATETATMRIGRALTPVTEDSTRHRGDPSTSLIGGTVGDPDLKAKRGVAITGMSGQALGTWQYSVTGGSRWLPIPAVSNASALLLRDVDRVRFLPFLNSAGVASLNYRVWDQTGPLKGTLVNLTAPGSTGGASGISALEDVGFVQVLSANDQPTLDINGEVPLSPVGPGNTNPPGDTVARVLGSSATDPDNTNLGIAIVSISKIGGEWQFSTDGGANWTPMTAVAAKTAVLLRSSDMVRFVPLVTFAGTANFMFRAWDQTQGTVGTPFDVTKSTSVSRTAEKANLKVTAIAPVSNTAPVLDNSATPILPQMTEDVASTGSDVRTLLTGAVTDPDLKALRGIAVIGTTSTAAGQWQYSLTGGRSWVNFGAVSPSSAVLLTDVNRVRFLPSANSIGDGTITYHAWDRTRGAAGQRADLSLAGATGTTRPFSLASETASVTIVAANDAPVLNTVPNTVLSNIGYTPSEVNHPGQTVGSFANDLITDADPGALKGIAVTGATSKGAGGAGFAAWQYQLDGTTDWLNIPFDASDATALLLSPADKVRIVPFGGEGVATLKFRAWDQTTTGTAGQLATVKGSTAFSKLFETATLVLNTANDRPILDTKPSPVLSPMLVNGTATNGDLVSSVLGSSVIDYDQADLRGIAITAVTMGKGTWEFSTNNGTSWQAIGTVTNSSALLLRDTDRVRFTPLAGFTGSVTMTFKAWDRTTGSEGTKSSTSSTAFSTLTDKATLIVNTAPTLTL